MHFNRGRAQVLLKAVISCESFNSRSEYEEATRGAQFLATIDVNTAQFPTLQDVNSKLIPQKNEAFKIFKIEPSDEILHDDEPTVFEWKMASSDVSSKSEKALSCQNGGILLPNSTCYCLPYFQGANCEIRICLNGGFATKTSPRCYCPPGYGGLHCEPLPCIPITQSTFDFTKKSLVYVVSTRDSMAFDITALIAATINVTNYYQNTQPGYFDSYQTTAVLATDNGTSIYIDHQLYMRPQDFVLGVESFKILGGDTYQPILTAILGALSNSRRIHAQSPVYIFADSMASDVQLEGQVIQAALSWGTQLIFVISQPPAAEYPFSGTDEGLHVYYRLARATQGEVLFVGDQKQLVDMSVRTILPFQYDTETILNTNRIECTAQHKQSIIIDPGAPAAYAYAVGGNMILITNNNTNLETPIITVGQVPYVLEVFKLDPTVTSVTFYVVRPGPCSYRVFVPSNNSVLIGYTNNLFIDSFAAVTNAGFAHAIVARINVPNWTNMSVSFLSENDQVPLYTPGANYLTRPACTFPQLFNPWPTCPVGPYNAMVYIYSDAGAIQRTIPGYCFPAQPPPSPPPLNCQNGGTPLTSACECPALYTGRNCEITTCINGATPNPTQGSGQSACFCMPGYTGAHCEHLQCNPDTPLPTFDLNHKSMALVIQQTFTMSASITEMAKAITNITGVYAAQNPDYFTNFTLTTFLTRTVTNGPQNEVTINTTFYTDGAKFAKAAHLGGAFTQATAHPVMQAIFSTLVDSNDNIIIKPRSPVFILVDSEPSDVQYLSQVQDVILQSQSILYFIVTSPYYTTSSCISPKGPGMIAFRQLAAVSGGLVLNFCNQSFGDTAVQQFITYFGSIQYRLETISQIDLLDCSGGIQEPFGVEASVSIYYVALQSNVGTLSLIKMAGNITQSPPPHQSLPGFKLYRLVGMDKGIYSVVISGVTGSCSLRIFEPSFLSVFYGFTPNPSIDVQSSNALLGKIEHPAVHLSAALQSTVELTVAIMDQEYHTLYYSSSEIRNDLCHYDYFMTAGFVCSHPFQYFYVKFIVNSDVPIQRSLIGYCKGLQAGTCLNDGTYNQVIAQCQCHASWSGQFCQTPLCYNGGSLRVQDQSCVCPPGFNGDHCEFGACSSFNLLAWGAPPLFVYKSVAFVVQSTADTAAMRLKLMTGINGFLYNTEVSQEKQYVLITFTTTTVSNVISTADSKVFGDVFNKTLAPGVRDNDEMKDNKDLPPAMILEGLLAAVQLTLVQPAIIFVFADVSPISNGAVNTELLKRLGQANIQVNFIISPSAQPIAGNDTGTGIMNQLAAYSSGRVLYVTAPNLDSLVETYLAATTDENGFISEYIFPDCSADGNMAYFPIESGAGWFSVVVVGYLTQVQLWDPFGHLVPTNDTNIALNDPGTFIVAIFAGSVDHFAGYWTVSVKSIHPFPGVCNVQIRVASTLQVSYGYVIDPMSDFPTTQPYAGGLIANRAVASIPGPNAAAVTLSYFKAFTISGVTGSTTLIDTAKMHPRDSSCAYQWYSDIFSSPQVGFGAEIIGTDSMGYPFKRIRANYFIPPNCQNGGQPSDYGGCNCTSTWTGLDCTIPICLNGGTLDITVCNCGNGYFGTNCGSVVTDSQPTTTPPATTQSTMPPSASTTASPAATTTASPAPTPSSSPGATTTAPSSTSAAGTSTSVAMSSSSTSPSCDLTTAHYDVAFFLDVSTNGMMTLPWQRNVTLSFTQNFVFGPTASQFIPGSYAKIPFLFGMFNTFKNQPQFANTINTVVGSLGLDPSALNLGAALTLLNNNALGAQSGLRPNSNHLIIFYASKNIDDIATAQQMADTFRGMTPPFHILGIASNPGVAANIAPIVGGASCVTSLDSAADVPNVINWLVQKACSQTFC